MSNLEKAKDIDEFVRSVAQSLEIGACVRYDLNTLVYGEYQEGMYVEYDRYLEMEDLPENLDDDLHDWEIETVKYIREVLDLPDEIEPPRTRKQLEWMADFADGQSVGGRFFGDVQKALDSRHPFGAYKDVMYAYDLLDDWYLYREKCYCHYVRHELDLPEE